MSRDSLYDNDEEPIGQQECVGSDRIKDTFFTVILKRPKREQES